MRRVSARTNGRKNFPADSQPAWEQFIRGLSDALDHLRDGEFLIVEVISGGYVQFARDSQRLYVEAMSLQYVIADPTLGSDARMIAALKAEMGELGWLLPESPPPEFIADDVPRTGSPNYSLQWDVHAASEEAARCAVATLRRVFAAGTPRDLRYEAFANAPLQSAGFPQLRIPRIRR